MHSGSAHGVRVPIAFLAVYCCLVAPVLAQRDSLDRLLPVATPGWRLSEAPRSFVGNDLFNMIDGGAALYQEYGFDRAVSGKYEDSTGRGIDVEIYAMTDSSAAYGIFGITAMAGEQRLPIGDDGQWGEYFLVFRKGRHVAVVSGQSSDTLTMDGVKMISRAIQERIASGSQAPPLVRRFDSFATKGSRPVFLRGVIGVGNFYMFAPQNVFNVREGITGERDSTRFFVFRYVDAEESIRNFHAAVEALTKNTKYSGVHCTGNRFEAIDRDGNLLRGSSTRDAIVVVVGRDAVLARKTEQEVTELLGTL
jgi:hypothetical protein